MARKNHSEVVTSDDKSENFDYLADADKGVEWETMPTLTREEIDNLPVSPVLHDGTPNPYYHADNAPTFGGTDDNEERPVIIAGENWEYDNGEKVPAADQMPYAVTVDNAPAKVIEIYDLLIGEALRLASCGDGECLEDNTQYGGRVFSLNEVILYCYRLEVSKSDAEIAGYVAEKVKAGVLIKAPGRGQYQASAIMRMSLRGVRELVEKKLTKL